MTFTRGIGVVCGAIIDRIVRWLALSKIHPNALTAFGLVINIWAAWLFARAGNAADPRVDFRWAALVIIGAGLYIFLRERDLGRPETVVNPPV